MTLRHGEVNSTHEIVKLNCHGCRHKPRAPYLPVSAISLELIWISESLPHMTRTAVALLRQMRVNYLTVRMRPHAQSGQPAWPPRSRRSSLCRSVIVRKSGREKKNCLKVTLAWHMRYVPTNRYKWKRERSRTMKDALLTGMLCRLPADNAKNGGAFQAPLASVNHSHGAFWQILNIHDDELLGCHRSENCK